jgi:DNA-directed RNA polymerase subunit M/transcription elongation factor TFIIS
MPPKAKKGYSTLLLSQKGDVEQLTVPGPTTGFTLEAIQTHFKKTQKLSPIGSYPYKAYTLFLFGTLDGPEGTENQHQMPAPYDSTVFYQDILIVVSKDENAFTEPVTFTVEEYETFYTKSFGGYISNDDGESDNEIVEEVEPAAVEDDTKDFAAEEADEEDEEEEEEEEELAGEDPEAEVPAKVRTPKKKKATVKNSSVSILSGTASAYPDRPILAEAEQLQEESIPTELHTQDSEHRRRVYASLQKVFAGDLTELQICQLESSVYNGAIKRARSQRIVRSWTYPLFVHTYLVHARHIASNFCNKSYVGNTELFERFKNGEIQIQDLSKMDQYELNPTRWKAQFDNQQMREKRQLEGDRSMATDMFLCKRCGKRECTYYEMQTRSADEPMTIFITCLACGKHWRQ